MDYILYKGLDHPQILASTGVLETTHTDIEGKGKGKVAQLCPALCDPMDYRVHGNLQARILDWVAIPIPFCRGSSQPRDKTQVSHTAGRFFTSWATKESQLEGSPWLILSKQLLFTALESQETESDSVGEGGGVVVSVL